MAKVLGETARYVTKQSIKKYQWQFLTIFLAAYFFALVVGFYLGFDFNKHPYLRIAILILLAGIVVIARSLINRVIDNLEKKRIDFRKGATGEALVGYILAGFPDAYRIIPGVETSFGDIDHVVVGPTGVYAVDTKNWRGIVTADGEGELLLNGRPTKKPAIGNLTRSIMTTKKKIKVRSALDPYVRGVLAFPSARVEAKWGTTGSVHCITDEQLYDYIVEKKKRLTKKEIDSISQAFLAVARKDKDFAPASR
ncbi:MAG: NERD domain-containing protein [Candidatus Aminicenantes bacterium]|nr:NERD domain-containing protein [Candidatus Aminicenantes bacterium]